MQRTLRLVLAGTAAVALIAALATAALLRIPTYTVRVAGSGGAGQSLCIAHHPQPGVWYRGLHRSR